MTSAFSVRQKLAWGGAAFATALLSGSYGALLALFYHDTLGLPARWIAVAAAIYAAWNAINDPLFGYLTDNTRSRWGRRMPYLRFGGPALGLAFFLVWLAPASADPWIQFWWMLFAMLLFDTFYTMVSLADSALLPEVAESEDARAELQAWGAAFSLAGLMAGFMIPNMVRPRIAGDSLMPLRATSAVMGIGAALLIFHLSQVFHERPKSAAYPRCGPWKALRFTFSSRPFLVLSAQNFMSILTQALLTGCLFYLADYVLKGPTLLPLLALFGALMIGIPLAGAARRRLGLVGAQQVFLAVGGLGLWSILWLPLHWTLLGLSIGGIGLAGPLALTNVLFGQVADDDERRSGMRREGSFFGANALLTKPAQSLALALIAGCLERAGFIPHAKQLAGAFASQPADAGNVIRALVGPVPGTAMLIGATLLFFYPLGRGSGRQDGRSDSENGQGQISSE
ncbi:MAG: MFS transporter [Elusimicrobiota bacterium]